MGNKRFDYLPSGLLYDVLCEKLDEQRVTPPVVHILDKLFQTVNQKSRLIRDLFDEFTPHDETHTTKLFDLASNFLGEQLIRRLSLAELLILIFSLQVHDWGMAVEEDQEKIYIINSYLKGSVEENKDFQLIENESRYMHNFVKNHGLEKSNLIAMPKELWREYVRSTHAARSGAKFKKFIKAENVDDSGISVAVEKVCAGHTKDIIELKTYPVKFNALDRNVNLQALALYVRLLDLFDISESRTPYAIWKFISPKNPYSKMEWAKHRAITSVFCHNYVDNVDGRYIQVVGHAENLQLYEALEDLKLKCIEELNNCRNLLISMGNAAYYLPIYDIDWLISPEDFTPYKLNFDWQSILYLIEPRDRTDCYNFLYYLAKISIDAMCQRRDALLEKKQRVENIGRITITVFQQEGEDIQVIWKDDGIGMNETILKECLSVTSNFEQEVRTNQINKNDILNYQRGILSCFLVAKSITITTLRDEILEEETSQGLEMYISVIENHFTLKHLPYNSCDVGTKITINIDNQKLNKYKTRNFGIRDYIFMMLNFFDFPINIVEDDYKTVVLSPQFTDQLADPIKINPSEEYPWETVFGKNKGDLRIPQKVFSQKTLHVEFDLGMQICKVFITYLTVTSEDISLIYELEHKLRVKCKNDREIDGEVIVVNSSNSIMSEMYCVFKDGLSVSKLPRPASFFDNLLLPPPKMIINILSHEETFDLNNIHIDRFGENLLRNAFVNSIVNQEISQITNYEPGKCLVEAGKLMAYNNIRPLELLNCYPADKYQFVLLNKDGKLQFEEGCKLKEDSLYEIPDFLKKYFEQQIKDFLVGESSEAVLSGWTSGLCIISADDCYSSNNILHHCIIEFYKLTFDKLFYRKAVRFLKTQSEKYPYLPQYKLDVKNVEYIDQTMVIRKAKEEPSNLTAQDIHVLLKNFYNEFKIVLPDIIEFSPPFHDKFAYGWEIINFKHPLAVDLIKLIASLLDVVQSQSVSRQFIDDINNIFVRAKCQEVMTLFNRWEKMWHHMKTMGIVNGSFEKLTTEMFVEHTIDKQKNPYEFCSSKTADIKSIQISL